MSAVELRRAFTNAVQSASPNRILSLAPHRDQTTCLPGKSTSTSSFCSIDQTKATSMRATKSSCAETGSVSPVLRASSIVRRHAHVTSVKGRI
ncbi:DUF2563 family protein [Sphingopyxis terrae subsp. terrae]|nr:DUF2563 family protein [Sphingopyxis terrae subsp. terrae]